MEDTHFGGDEVRRLSGEPRTSTIAASGHNQATGGLIGRRKRVYGNDMLYVTAPDGSKIGRVNLETGRVTMDLAILRDMLDRFVKDWRATHMGAQPPSGGDRSDTTGSLQDDRPLVTPAPPADADTAGVSAQNMYNRKSARELAKKQQIVAADARWRQEAKAARPVMGRLAAALTAKPKITPESQTTANWRVGAEGERLVGEVLKGVRGIEVLHDRLIPGSRANIDHLVVGPSGVFVIDAKKYTGKLEARDVGGMFRHDPRLYVKGRDRTKLVDGVRHQIEVVRTTLGDEFAGVAIRGVLCFIGVEWPLLRRPQRVKGVVVVWPQGLPKVVTSGRPLNDRVVDVATHLRTRLRPAGG